MPWSYLHSQQINQGTKKWYNSLWWPLTRRRIIKSLHFWPRVQCTINIFKYYLFKIMAMTLIIIRKRYIYNNLLRIQGCVLVKRMRLRNTATILGGYLATRIAFQGTMGMQALRNSQLIDHSCVALRWILWDGLLVWWRNISLDIPFCEKLNKKGNMRFELTSNDMASDNDLRQLSMFCTPHARSAPAFLTRNLDLCKQCSSE